MPQAIRGVAAALETACGTPASEQTVMLVGIDGVRGKRVVNPPIVRYFDLPLDGNYDNTLRNTLLKAARGKQILLVDDDNVLTSNANLPYSAHPKTAMVVGKIDITATLDASFIPIYDEYETIRQFNIDPLCLCLSRESVAVRSDVWQNVENMNPTT